MNSPTATPTPIRSERAMDTAAVAAAAAPPLPQPQFRLEVAGSRAAPGIYRLEHLLKHLQFVVTDAALAVAFRRLSPFEYAAFADHHLRPLAASLPADLDADLRRRDHLILELSSSADPPRIVPDLAQWLMERFFLDILSVPALPDAEYQRQAREDWDHYLANPAATFASLSLDVDGEPAGDLLIELFPHLPRATAALCALLDPPDASAPAAPAAHSLVGAPVQFIVRDGWVQLGDARADVPIPLDDFDPATTPKHTARGLVSILHPDHAADEFLPHRLLTGPHATPRAQLFLTLGHHLPDFDFHYLVVGALVDGYHLLDRIERLPVDSQTNASLARCVVRAASVRGGIRAAAAHATAFPASPSTDCTDFRRPSALADLPPVVVCEPAYADATPSPLSNGLASNSPTTITLNSSTSTEIAPASAGHSGLPTPTPGRRGTLRRPSAPGSSLGLVFNSTAAEPLPGVPQLPTLAASAPAPAPASHDALLVGDRVAILMGAHTVLGTLRFLGETQFKPGLPWAGIELDVPGSGKNDGSVQDIKYFECPPKRGIFVPVDKVRRESSTTAPTATESPAASPTVGSLAKRVSLPGGPGSLGHKRVKHNGVNALFHAPTPANSMHTLPGAPGSPSSPASSAGSPTAGSTSTPPASSGLLKRPSSLGLRSAAVGGNALSSGLRSLATRLKPPTSSTAPSSPSSTSASPTTEPKSSKLGVAATSGRRAGAAPGTGSGIRAPSPRSGLRAPSPIAPLVAAHHGSPTNGNPTSSPRDPPPHSASTRKFSIQPSLPSPSSASPKTPTSAGNPRTSRSFSTSHATSVGSSSYAARSPRTGTAAGATPPTRTSTGSSVRTPSSASTASTASTARRSTIGNASAASGTIDRRTSASTTGSSRPPSRGTRSTTPSSRPMATTATIKESPAQSAAHEQLVREHTALTREHADLTAEHLRLVGEHDRVVREHARLTQEVATLSAQIADAFASRAANEDALRATRAELEAATAAAAAADAERASLRARLDQLESDNQYLQTELQLLVQQKMTPEEVQALLGDVDSLTFDLHKAQGRAGELADQLRDREERLAAAELERSDAVTKLRAVERARDAQFAEMDRLRDTIAELQDHASGQHQEQEYLRLLNDRKKMEVNYETKISALESAVKTSTEAADALRADMARAQAALDAERAAMEETLRQERAALAAGQADKITALEMAARARDAEAREWEHRYVGARAEVSAKSATLDAMQEELTDLRRTKHELAGALAALQAQLAAHSETVAAMEKEVMRVEQERAAAADSANNDLRLVNEELRDRLAKANGDVQRLAAERDLHLHEIAKLKDMAMRRTPPHGNGSMPGSPRSPRSEALPHDSQFVVPERNGYNVPLPRSGSSSNALHSLASGTSGGALPSTSSYVARSGPHAPLHSSSSLLCALCDQPGHEVLSCPNVASITEKLAASTAGAATATSSF
ncbi:hypothetical protein H9P43_008943 [Blastocladiella emersonii ATCC 22665]|nr:hypothetical protein H9P43_008943 [Blastocladiella emersonii ATCC 22665]